MAYFNKFNKLGACGGGGGGGGGGGQQYLLVIINFVLRISNYSQLSISQSKIYPKLLISQSKFSGSRKFTLRYQ